jgi:hypothetical protein
MINASKKLLSFDTLNKNPDIFLFCFISFFLIWYGIFDETFEPLSYSLTIDIIMFVFCFIFTYRFFNIFLSAIGHRTIKRIINKKHLYYLSIALFFFVLIKFFFLLIASGAESALDFRLFFAGVDDGEAKSIGAGIAFPFLMASYYISKIESDVKYSRLFLYMSLIVAILSTAKIFLLLFLFYVLSINRYRLSFKGLFIISLYGFGLFALSSIVLNKFSNDGDGNLLLAILNTFNVYFMAGLAAFQNILDGIYPNDDGWMKIGNWLTNVYTAFYSWYQLFGEHYTIVSGILLGFFYSVFVNKSKLFHQLFYFYSIFLLYPLFMIVFAEQYIEGFKMHVIYLFCSIIVGLVKLKGERIENQPINNNR